MQSQSSAKVDTNMAEAGRIMQSQSSAEVDIWQRQVESCTNHEE